VDSEVLMFSLEGVLKMKNKIKIVDNCPIKDYMPSSRNKTYET
jgi:hypothetical protein